MTIEKLLGLPRDGLLAIARMSDDELKSYIGEIVTTESSFKDEDFLYKKFLEADKDEENPITKLKKKKKTKKNTDDEANNLMRELELL